jgi:hypothetical protein
MDTFNISEGRVIPGSGVAEYTIVYRAIVWKPFKGETVRLLRLDGLFWMLIVLLRWTPL